jgi:hypothetical protein
VTCRKKNEKGNSRRSYKTKSISTDGKIKSPALSRAFHSFSINMTSAYRNAASVYVGRCLPSTGSGALVLEISLLTVFSDWLIFTACKTAIVAISSTRTSTVRVFPFFMVNWINIISDKVIAVRGQTYDRNNRTQDSFGLFCGQ